MRPVFRYLDHRSTSMQLKDYFKYRWLIIDFPFMWRLGDFFNKGLE